MNIKTLATLAAAIMTTSTSMAAFADTKCGAGSCGKKEKVAPEKTAADTPERKDAQCSKKESTAKGSEAGCSKKEVSCSKKDATCAKK